MKGLIVQLGGLVITFFVICRLWQWPFVAFYPPFDQLDEAFAKPWRPWARLALSAILAVMMLTVQAFIALRRNRA